MDAAPRPTVFPDLVDTLQPVWGTVLAGGVSFTIDALAPDGSVLPVASSDEGELVVGPTPTRSTYAVDVPPTTIPGGHRIRLSLLISGIYTSTLRLLYGGGTYADGGLTLQTGTLVG
jgi:hypothetical protein